MLVASLGRLYNGRRSHRCMLSCLVITATIALASIAQGKTFVLPHILERSGLVGSTTYTFDTTIFMTYAGGRAGEPDGGGSTVDLYLIDQATSLPMTAGGGAPVCNPCTWNLNAATPSRSVVVEDLINAAGGFGGSSVKLGFGVVVVTGDADRTRCQGFIVNSHTSAFDVSALYFNPKEYVISRWSAPTETRRTWVLPHILEKSGTASTTPFTFDTTVFAVYMGGLGDAPNGGAAEVQLYLYDQASGLPLRGMAGTEVCNPCLESLSSSTRKRSFNVDNLIGSNGGGFDTEVKQAFGVVVVTGDIGPVELQGFVVNSHTSPFDLSVFGFTPEEITTTTTSAVTDPLAAVRMPIPMVGFPNPFNPRTTLAFELVGEQDVTLQIHDAAGRLVRTLLHESRAAGKHTVPWDGKDAAGRSLASGVYYASLVAQEGRLHTKLVLLQ